MVPAAVALGRGGRRTATAAAVGLGGGGLSRGTAFAGVVGTGRGHPRRPRPVAGRRPRRRRVDFVEQEAENAATNGTVIGPDRTAYTLPAEASGRSAVSLTPGQYVEFTLPSAANAITVRYSIPDAPTGGGITAPLDVTVNGGHASDDDAHLAVRVAVQPVPVLQRPERRPAAPRLVDHRVLAACPTQTTPTPVFPTPFRPNHFYDEQRLLLGRTYRGRRQDPADRAGRQRRRHHRHRPARLAAGRAAEARPARRERAAVRRRPDRPARLGRRDRQGHRVRQEDAPARSTSRRARTR